MLDCTRDCSGSPQARAEDYKRKAWFCHVAKWAQVEGNFFVGFYFVMLSILFFKYVSFV